MYRNILCVLVVKLWLVFIYNFPLQIKLKFWNRNLNTSYRISVDNNIPFKITIWQKKFGNSKSRFIVSMAAANTSSLSLFLGQLVYWTVCLQWSFGVVLWELITLAQQPYSEIDPFEMSEFLRDGYRLAQPITCPDDLYVFIIYAK